MRAIGTVSHVPIRIGGVDNVHIEAVVTDAGGSELFEVKVHDIDNNDNYSMTYNEGLSRWIVNIPRTQEGWYTFNYQIIASIAADLRSENYVRIDKGGVTGLWARSIPTSRVPLYVMPLPHSK